MPWKILIPLLLPVILVSAFILVYLRNPQANRDTIVLADLASQTADPALDSSLASALASDLEQARFPRILSAAEVAQALGSRGAPATGFLDEEAARTVCRRTGSKAVVAGSVAKSGGDFIVDLKATGCSTAQVVAEARMQTTAKDRVLEALQQTALQLGAKLVESH